MENLKKVLKNQVEIYKALPDSPFEFNRLPRLFVFDRGKAHNYFQLIETNKLFDDANDKWVICAFPVDVFDDRTSRWQIRSSSYVRARKSHIILSVLKECYYEIGQGDLSQAYPVGFILPPELGRLRPGVAEFRMFNSMVKDRMSVRDVNLANEERILQLQEHLQTDNAGAYITRYLELLEGWARGREKVVVRDRKKEEEEDYQNF